MLSRGEEECDSECEEARGDDFNLPRLVGSDLSTLRTLGNIPHQE